MVVVVSSSSGGVGCGCGSIGSLYGASGVGVGSEVECSKVGLESCESESAELWYGAVVEFTSVGIVWC